MKVPPQKRGDPSKRAKLNQKRTTKTLKRATAQVYRKKRKRKVQASTADGKMRRGEPTSRRKKSGLLQGKKQRRLWMNEGSEQR